MQHGYHHTPFIHCQHCRQGQFGVQSKDTLNVWKSWGSNHRTSGSWLLYPLCVCKDMSLVRRYWGSRAHSSGVNLSLSLHLSQFHSLFLFCPIWWRLFNSLQMNHFEPDTFFSHQVIQKVFTVTCIWTGYYLASQKYVFISFRTNVRMSQLSWPGLLRPPVALSPEAT